MDGAMEGIVEVEKKKPWNHGTKVEITTDKATKLATPKDGLGLILIVIITLTRNKWKNMCLKKGTKSWPPKPSPSVKKKLHKLKGKRKMDEPQTMSFRSSSSYDSNSSSGPNESDET